MNVKIRAIKIALAAAFVGAAIAVVPSSQADEERDRKKNLPVLKVKLPGAEKPVLVYLNPEAAQAIKGIETQGEKLAALMEYAKNQEGEEALRKTLAQIKALMEKEVDEDADPDAGAQQ